MNYMDQFYSMGEFFFHVQEEGVYNVRFSFSSDTEVEIAVRDVLVEDALTGVELRPIKTKSVYGGAVPEAEAARVVAGVRAMDAEKRRALEDRVWNSVWTRCGDSTWAGRKDAGFNDYFFHGVPVECLKDLSGLDVNTNFNAVTAKSFVAKYGQWRWSDFAFVNDKLKLRYTMEDLLAGRPIPEPYPLPWNELGHWAIRGNYEKLVLWRDFNFDRCRNQFDYELCRDADGYLPTLEKKGDLKRWPAERIYADLVAFVRLAYDYPLLDEEMTETGYQRLRNGPWNRGALHHRTNYAGYLSWYTQYQNVITLYDRLFPLIKGNRALADAVGRHVSWVKTPEDVIRIFDSYMVQDIVKRCMRHQLYTMPGTVLTANRVLNYDKKLTDDFAKWSFSSDFRYPVYGGLQYIMQNNLDRAGTAPSSSSYYTAGENGVCWAEELLSYSLESGEKTYCFQDAKRYPKFRGALLWCHEMPYAGGQYPHIGDVAGPDRPADDHLRINRQNFDLAWRFWKDPASAALLHYVYGETTDPELVSVAKTFERLPYLTYPSRMIPNWCGILEIGKRHDDFRFRRGLMVRAGRHYGHHHADSLDLQIAAHGLVYIADGGQRKGYTKPSCYHGRVHCTVTRLGEDTAGETVDREESGCISAIADGEHFASLSARSGRGRSVRHVALVDVDDGPAQRLPIEMQKPGVKLDPVAKTPNAYVFDVFREKARGGRLSYNFHAANDAADRFRWDAATCLAEWQILREPELENGKRVNMAYEPFQLGVNFDPKSPLKYLRLHLANLDATAKAQTERFNDHTRGNRMTMLHVVAEAPEGKVFAAVIEPYEGTPFVKSVTALPMEGTTGAWDDPVGVVVETTNGQRNVHLSAVAGRPVVGPCRLDAGNAFVGADAKGVRRVVLTGGTRLIAPGLSIVASASTFTGTVVKVDYVSNKMVLEAMWDVSRVRFPKIVHVSNRFGLDTSFTVTEAKTFDGKTVLSFKEPGNVYISDIGEITAEGRIVGQQPVFRNYNLDGCTLANSARTKFWKSKGGVAVGATKPVLADFAPDGVFSAWEYGPGDTVTLETAVIVERQADGTYKTASDVPCEVSFK